MKGLDLVRQSLFTLRHPADLRWEGEHRHDMFSGAPAGRRNRRIARVSSPLELIQPGRRLYRFGAAGRLQMGHHILAALPGDESQQFVAQMHDAGLDRGLRKHRGDPIDKSAMSSFTTRAGTHKMVVEK